ncbi:glycoside hydrolase 5 family protein [Zunongwangia endophytica]|uniref:mannan endo-1,4-beta-mannosidase n=1 Tax=Zunongwangia endophytica TaxID=1808945 RepID=A0ABV8H8Y7_9FLAO|nr:beta-mannanase [Zunongwangia endophytica]MDN3595115.1 beta-mannanase [Zunongwangia endophytica]
MIKRLFSVIILCILCYSCQSVKPITVKDGQFYKGKQPYYFVGANYWYGPLIAAPNIGDRERLIKELDMLDSLGVDNLRILVGGEGGIEDSQVNPALQYEQGKYNQDLLEGLDFLMNEMRKRNMYAVLYLNNNWIWSGGMSTYLRWNGYGDVPNPFLEEYTWPQYFEYTQQFHTCEPCQEAFKKHIKFIMTRTNSVNGMVYTDDNTIMSWQVANEPRIFSEEDRKPFASWLAETVTYMDSLDPNTLISTGAEGKASYLQDLDTYKNLHATDKIDYLTAHMWPKNWGWYDKNNEAATLQTSIKNAHNYIEEHIEVAKALHKPLVLSEFGFPRDGESLERGSPVTYRNQFYTSILEELKTSFENQNVLSGLNFWGFAGIAKTNPNQPKWKTGDDFTADPPQEPQGLNSIFAEDTSTLQLMKTYNSILSND